MQLNKTSSEKKLVYFSPDRAGILTKSLRAREIKAKAGHGFNWNEAVCFLILAILQKKAAFSDSFIFYP